MDVSKLLERAREATERRNYDYAIELYLQACTMSPDNATARRELRAVENRKSKENPPSFWEKGKTLGMQAQVQLLYSTKKYDAAIQKAEEALRIDPGNISVLMLLGRAALEANYRQTAIATFEDIKTMNAGGNTKALVEAMRELAHAYEADNKIKEAQEIWHLVSRQAPGDREATQKARDLSARAMSTQIENSAKAGGPIGGMARAAQTDAQKKDAAKMDRSNSMDIKTDADLQLAIEDAKEEIQKRPNDPRICEVHAKLGDLYKQGANYAEAKKAYECAHQVDPNNYTWLFKLHDLEIWKLMQSIKPLEAKRKAGDASVNEQYQKERLALQEYRLTSFLEREKQYSTDSRIRYDLGCVFYDLATLKGEKGYFDEAIKRFQGTFQDPKFRVDSGLRMGLGFSAKGQYDLALKRFDETLKGMELKDERWKNVIYAKADTLQKAGKKDEARTAFLEIYEIDVSFKDIAKRVDDLSQAPT